MTTAVPTTPREWEDYLDGLDTPEKYAKAVTDGSFKAAVDGYVKAYAAEQNGTMEDLAKQVKEQTQIAFHDLLKANGYAVSRRAVNKMDLSDVGESGANGYHKLHNPKAVGAPLDGVFPDMATFLQTVWNQKANPFRTANAEAYQKLMAYQESIPSEGGFLVPEEFRGELLRMSLGTAIVRPRARVIPMSSATLRFPKIDETSRVSSVFGGVVVYRTEEGAELAESAAAFGSIKLEATKQTALAHVTNELVRDWGAFGVFVNEIFPEAIGFYEDVDFLTGSGAGEPLGALAAANGALVTVSKQAAQAASTIVWENVIKMYARMLPSSIPRAVWLASPDTFAELATMALVVGTGGSAVWIVDATGTPVLTLLGRPVIMTEKAPAALGTKGDLSFVDFGMYLIGDRQEMRVDSSEHVKFTSDKTTYRVIQRNDGRPWLESPLTPRNNSATLSPFVNLETRS